MSSMTIHYSEEKLFKKNTKYDIYIYMANYPV